MKKHIKIVIALLIFNTIEAQQIVDLSTYNTSTNTDKYFKDINNHYTKFLGTWENVTGNKTFRVVLWKVVRVENLVDINCFI